MKIMNKNKKQTKVSKSTYIKKIPCLISFIRIDKNFLGYNSLIFYENQKFRPHIPILGINFRFFQGCQS